MSLMSEREIEVSNDETCPSCFQPYPASTDGVESVTCGKCQFVNVLRPPAPDRRALVERA